MAGHCGVDSFCGPCREKRFLSDRKVLFCHAWNRGKPVDYWIAAVGLVFCAACHTDQFKIIGIFDMKSMIFIMFKWRQNVEDSYE